jgi:hypothetical protein
LDSVVYKDVWVAVYNEVSCDVNVSVYNSVFYAVDNDVNSSVEDKLKTYDFTTKNK